MATRRSLIVVLVGAFLSLGASFRTTNFVVEAPTPQIAQQVGEYAEYYRKQKALQWLGQEMAQWPEPCPLKVSVTMNGSGGATSFAFDRGRVLGQNMHIEGSLDRLLASVLPHEVTHTVFAYYFRTPVPRWADEGGSVLSEDDLERNRHDMLVRQILNTPGRAIPLRRLFNLRDYPSDVMCLYAEGYSVSSFLVSSSSQPAFLAFIVQGMRDGWDNAVRASYRYNNVEELEQAWLTHLRNTKRQPAAQLASNSAPAEVDPARRITVRQTAPPAQPLLETPRPIYRGQAPSEGENSGELVRSGNRGQPGYLPEYNRATNAPRSAPPANDWMPAPGQNVQSPPTVRLGAPQFPPVQQVQPPPGYPR